MAAAALRLVRTLSGELDASFVSPGSAFSFASLACALAIAVGVLAAKRLRRRGRLHAKALLRALLPRRRHGASHMADLGFFLFNTLAAGALVGWALLSTDAVAHAVASGLLRVWGLAPLRATPAWVAGSLVTLLLFTTYEFGYYVDHWLSHHVPALWEIHRPHHAAEALTPLTLFRVHPLESLKLMNILALSVGAVSGLCAAAFGPGREATLEGRNALFLVLWFAVGHLQHSNLWVTIPGPLGRLLISPAHHQLHHSADPRHYGRNLGNFLSVFDRLFGTLLEPAREREALTFGVPDAAGDPHGVTACLIAPMVAAAAVLRRPPAAVAAPESRG